MKLSTLALCAVASLPLTAAADSKRAPRFTSQTTPLYPSKQCKPLVAGEDIGDESLRCPARRGYHVELAFSAWATHLELTGPDTKLNFNGYIGERLEWRLADGKPFAVIVSVDEHGPDEDDAGQPGNTKLRVRGLSGWKIDAEVAADGKDAIKAARELADAAYRAQSAAQK